MATWGESVAQGGRPDVGIGVSQQLAAQIQEPKKITRNNWALGIVADDSPRDEPDQSGFGPCVDFDVTRDDALTTMPGIVVTNTEVGHNLKYIFQHASIDYSTELVVVDPPYLGYRSVGAFTWVATPVGGTTGIGATGISGWAGFNVAGTFVFSNGTNKTYSRQPGAATVTDISAQVVARTFATAFGRAFAGAPTTGAGFQALGVVWNAANGSPTDWTGTGSGGQLLIANQLEADILVALRPLGFQALAALTRKSLWLATPTFQANSPGDFQQRYIGIGCVAEKTARLTQDGVMFLSDDGVFLFSINGLEFMSEAINPLLLPIDYTRIDRYSAVYVPLRQRYILATPVGTFIYEIPKKRWLMRSVTPDNVLSFTDQSGTASWDTTPGSWDQQSLTWDLMAIAQANAPAKVYYTEGNQLGYEDQSTHTQFGLSNPINSTWITPDFTKDEVRAMVTTVGFEFEWISTGICEMDVYVTTEDGTGFDGARKVHVVLPSSGGLRRVGVADLSKPLVSLGGRWMVVFTAGTANIYRISQLYDPNSLQQSVALAL